MIFFSKAPFVLSLCKGAISVAIQLSEIIILITHDITGMGKGGNHSFSGDCRVQASFPLTFASDISRYKPDISEALCPAGIMLSNHGSNFCRI